MIPLRALTGEPPCSCNAPHACRSRLALRRSCRARHRVVECDPALVLLAGDRLEPRFVVEIPAYRSRQAGLEALRRCPAELAPDLARVDRIAAVVAGPI